MISTHGFSDHFSRYLSTIKNKTLVFVAGENHFSKQYAFWASEIVCGLNHLAVNDLNKVRIGQLGALPLYMQLLQSEDKEEPALATAGVWILAFRDENKRLMKDEPGFIDGNHKLIL